jgi:hypothetical protein
MKQVLLLATIVFSVLVTKLEVTLIKTPSAN